MSLYIEVYVGSRDNRIKVAECHAYNDSNLANVSNYPFKSTEKGYSPLGIPTSEVTSEILEHDRNSTVWSLVEKIARETVRKQDEEE